jgi:hypothetical protein
MKQPFRKPRPHVSTAPDRTVELDPVNALTARWIDEPAYKALQMAINGAAKLECDSYVETILRLHKNRDVRIVASTLSVVQLTEVAFNETKTRSSIVGIVVRVLRHLRKLEICRKNAKVSILAGDHTWLSDNVKTVAEKINLVEAMLMRADEIITELQTVKEIGEAVIGDIDKASYTTKLAGEGFNLEYRTERTLHGR